MGTQTSEQRRMERLARWSREALYGTHPMSPGRRKAVTASVSRVELQQKWWRDYKFASSAWQDDVWDAYDTIGQLRFISNWIGGCVSRAILKVVEIDQDGNPTTPISVDQDGNRTLPTIDDEQLAQLSAGPLGVGDTRAEALRLLGIDLYVGGEAYIIAESGGSASGADQWWVVTPNQIKRLGDTITINRSPLYGGGKFIYRPGQDLILRCWTPHPRDTSIPDSSPRSAISDLTLANLTKKRVAAELGSRLTSAGILCVPDSIDLPRGEDDPAGADGFSAHLGRAMSAAISDPASAAAMVPMILTGPPEAVKEIRHIGFWSELSEKIPDIWELILKSLGQGLDVPPEVMSGLGGTNHWCVTDEAEILTGRGWLTHSQIRPNDVAWTVDPATLRGTWQPISSVSRWSVEGYPMVSIDAPGQHRSLTTPNHRWLTAGGFVTTDDIATSPSTTSPIVATAEREPTDEIHPDAVVTDTAQRAAALYRNRSPGSDHAIVEAALVGVIRDLSPRQLGLYADTVRAEFGPDAELPDSAVTALVLSGRLPQTSTSRTFAPADATITRQMYTGLIWCPTTPTGTWTMRYQGHVTVTGNSAWAISESAITEQIGPVLSRMAAALTDGYLLPAAQVLGYSDSDLQRIAYRFDVAPLAVRPNRVADAVSYWDRGMISEDTAREAGAWPAGSEPTDDERTYRLAVDLWKRDPNTALADPAVRRVLGFSDTPTGGATGTPAPAADPPPYDPGQNTGPDTKPGNLDQPPAASTAAAGPDALQVATALLTRRAMTLAGQRLIPHRDRGAGTPSHQLSARSGPVSPTRAAELLAGGWRDVDVVAASYGLDPTRLVSFLTELCSDLLVRGIAYTDDMIIGGGSALTPAVVASLRAAP